MWIHFEMNFKETARANQLTGFYTMGTFAFNELITITSLPKYESIALFTIMIKIEGITQRVVMY